jgi:outer membrane protein
MRRIRAALALICCWQLAMPAAAEERVRRNGGGFLSGFTRPYRPQEVPPIDLANSPRLESLLRAGRIYLSLQDAIALALENNLDIAVQRYGPMIADAALLRANAGGLLRGVPTAVQRATTSALAQVTGAAGGAGGGGTTTAFTQTTGGSEAGGAIIVQTGTAVPNLDPVIFTQANFSHPHHPADQLIHYRHQRPHHPQRHRQFWHPERLSAGGSISFGWNNSRVETNAGRSDFNPSTTASFSLSIQQPLLRGFGLRSTSQHPHRQEQPQGQRPGVPPAGDHDGVGHCQRLLGSGQLP